MQILDLYAGSNKRTIKLVNPPQLDRDFFGDNDDEQTSRLAALLFHLEEDFFITFDEKNPSACEIFLGGIDEIIEQYKEYCDSATDGVFSFFDWCVNEIDNAVNEWNYDTDRCEFSRGNESYLVLDANEAEDAVSEYIEDSVWAFKASFIVSHCGLPREMEKMIAAYQKEECKNANKALLALIKKCGDFDEFVKQAIKEDGAAHFLSSYDGEEHEVFINHHMSSPPTNNVIKLYEYYIYRTN